MSNNAHYSPLFYQTAVLKNTSIWPRSPLLIRTLHGNALAVMRSSRDSKNELYSAERTRSSALPKLTRIYYLYVHEFDDVIFSKLFLSGGAVAATSMKAKNYCYICYSPLIANNVNYLNLFFVNFVDFLCIFLLVGEVIPVYYSQIFFSAFHCMHPKYMSLLFHDFINWKRNYFYAIYFSAALR